MQGLWDDIISAARVPADRRALFLGSVVIHQMRQSNGRDLRNLVDGQQRITTLSLLLACCMHKLRDLKRKGVAIDAETHHRAGELVNRIQELIFLDDDLLGSAQNPSEGLGDREARLVPSKRDRQNFEAILRTDKPKHKGTLMGKAWAELHRLIDAAVEERVEFALGDPADAGLDQIENLRAQGLCDIVNAVSKSVASYASFAEINVSSPYNPLMVFEALNSRNMPLAESDLIKNLIVQRVGQKKQEQVADEWDDISKSVNDESVKLLRYWFIASHRHIPVKDLYDEMQSIIHDEESALHHLKAWKEAAPWYEAMRGRDEAPSSKASVRAALREYSMMGFQQGYPVVLAFALHGGESRLPQVVHLLGTIYVRLLRTAQVRASVFEQKLESLCRAARASPSEGVAMLERTTEQLLLRHTKGLDWTQFTLQGAGLQKYVLRRLATTLESSSLAVAPPDVVEVEHIMPQKPTVLPPGMNKEQYDLLVQNVGNLTLINSADNKRLGNKSPAEKAVVYAEYADPTLGKQLRITGELKEINSWGREDIIKRAEQLAEIAEAAWPVPVADSQVELAS